MVVVQFIVIFLESCDSCCSFDSYIPYMLKIPKLKIHMFKFKFEINKLVDTHVLKLPRYLGYLSIG
jgi:hypothetical protein